MHNERFRASYSVQDRQRLLNLLNDLLPTQYKTESTPVIAPVLLMAGLNHSAKLHDADTEGQYLTVHEYQSIWAADALQADALYNLLIQRQPQAHPNSAFGFTSDILYQDTKVVVETKTTLRNLARSDLHRMKAVDLPASTEKNIQCWTETGLIAQAHVDRYLRLSGDENPVHSNLAIASSFGFAGPIIPGMLILGLAAQCASAFAGQQVCLELRARFMSPLLVGSHATCGIEMRRPRNASGNSVARVIALSPGRKISLIADLVLGSFVPDE